MAKFYKPGRVVVVTNGRYAGKKGIIIKSNFEQTKTKKYPHCVVLGLKKAPRRVTKKFLKKLEDKTKALTDKVNSKSVDAEELQKLKRFGVFFKTYNMNHILATRYKATDNFSIDNNMVRIENIELEIKEATTKLNKKESEEAKDKDGIEELKKKIGELRDKSKTALSEMKIAVGTELYNRFMKGFVLTKDNAEENDKIKSSEFLFNKLKF
jgi:large subunit ribosomal protein L27e